MYSLSASKWLRGCSRVLRVLAANAVYLGCITRSVLTAELAC